MSLFSFALGAILAFAVHRSPAGVSLQVVGLVLMLVGVVGFVTSLYFARWRRRIVEESVEHGVAPPIDVDGSILYEDGTRRGLSDRLQEREIIIREPPRD
ncbi:MAG TPA: DUF6458 family protein [Frankiaceae bacterium]|nr:DUF6458 family protein [Frankiaceae bacterium]